MTSHSHINISDVGKFRTSQSRTYVASQLLCMKIKALIPKYQQRRAHRSLSLQRHTNKKRLMFNWPVIQSQHSILLSTTTNPSVVQFEKSKRRHTPTSD